MCLEFELLLLIPVQLMQRSQVHITEVYSTVYLNKVLSNVGDKKPKIVGHCVLLAFRFDQRVPARRVYRKAPHGSKGGETPYPR